MRHTLTWLSTTRPDIYVSANMASQATSETFAAKQILAIRKIVNYIKETQTRRLRFNKLNKSALPLLPIRDAQFDNNPDLSWQVRYVMLLLDHSVYAKIISFSSYKSKHVVRSVLGAETYACADASDSAFISQEELERSLNVKVTIAMLTDQISIFNVMIKVSRTTEVRLGNDLSAAKEACKREEINDIDWLKTIDYFADAFTKSSIYKTLEPFIETGSPNQNVLQWKRRKGTDAVKNTNTSSSMESTMK